MSAPADAKLGFVTDLNDRLRDLPAVDALASSIASDQLSSKERVGVAREAIEIARARMLGGHNADAETIAAELAAAIELRSPTKMINGTGVLLHTNLGRALLSDAAANAARVAATNYTNLELDRVDGSRGKRGWHTSRLLTETTGAEDAILVNNNAAGVLLTLAALAPGKAVPVSRGELIEIGGSYRLPDVMKASGAHLVEVGTTNRTRVGDYVTALQVHECGLVLKVHHANYELVGFVSEVDVGDLKAISNVPVVFDIGSGLIDNAVPWLDQQPEWARREPGVRQALGGGADLVLFSGDKLLGGPQAGVIAGRSDLIDQIRRHPIARAMRVDSSTDAAMAATLQHYIDGDARSAIPFWRMATMRPELLEERVRTVSSSIGGSVEHGHSLIGAGSAPGARIDSPVLRLAGRQDLFESLLRDALPVLARRDAGDLLIDLRTVDPDDDRNLIDTLMRCL